MKNILLHSPISRHNDACLGRAKREEKNGSERLARATLIKTTVHCNSMLWWPGMMRIPWWFAKNECMRRRFRDYEEWVDMMGCQRPDPMFGGRARARHKSQESILERWQTEFQNHFRGFQDSMRVTINQIFLKVTVKEKFVPSCSFEENSYGGDTETLWRRCSWRRQRNPPC